MLYPKEMKRAQELAGEGKTAKQIVSILKRESPTFRTLTDSAKFRNVYRWIKTKKEDSSTNWIEVYMNKHKGRLPLIPEFMLQVVKDKTTKRVSKNMELSIPSLQWWNRLLCSQKEQILQTIDWLGQNRQDYLERINRLIPGHPYDLRLVPKRKIA